MVLHINLPKFSEMFDINWLKDTIDHFLFLVVSFVTSLPLVLAPVVKTFLVYYLPIVARPCVLPAPFFPFFL